MLLNPADHKIFKKREKQWKQYPIVLKIITYCLSPMSSRKSALIFFKIWLKLKLKSAPQAKSVTQGQLDEMTTSCSRQKHDARST